MPATATATAPRPSAAAAGTPKPRVNEKRKYVDANKARLSVVLRRFKSGFLTYVEHKEADTDRRLRGMYKQHDTEANARAEYERLNANADRDGWVERLPVPRSEFEELPRAAAATPAPARPARPAAAGGRRR